jgi:hypothetical protein
MEASGYTLLAIDAAPLCVLAGSSPTIATHSAA